MQISTRTKRVQILGLQGGGYNELKLGKWMNGSEVFRGSLRFIWQQLLTKWNQ